AVSMCKTYSVLAALCRVSPKKGASEMKARFYFLPNSLFRLLWTVAALLLVTVGMAAAQTLSPGDLIVTSPDDGRVLHYDNSGNFLDMLWDTHAVNGALGIAYNADGDLFVGGAYTNLISRYNPDTRTFDPFITGGEGGAISNPHQINFGGPNNDLYVANLGGFFGLAGSVAHFDGKTGALKETIGYGGDAPGVAVDAAGIVYFSNRAEGKVYRYDGSSVTLFADIAPAWAEGLALGPDGNLYVGTYHTGVLRYKPDGT